MIRRGCSVGVYAVPKQQYKLRVAFAAPHQSNGFMLRLEFPGGRNHTSLFPRLLATRTRETGIAELLTISYRRTNEHFGMTDYRLIDTLMPFAG